MVHTPTYDSALEDLLHKVGPKVLKELENFEAPLKAALTKVQRQGEVVLKRIKAGENKSFGFLADGASTTAGATVGYDTYSLKGKIFFGKITIDRGAAVQARGNAKTTADIVMSEIETASRTALRQLDSAIVNGSEAIFSIDGTQATALGTITAGTPETILDVPAAVELRAGMALDVYDSGGNYETTVQVTKRDVDFESGTHNVTVDVLSGSYVTQNGDEFYLRGAKDNGMTGIRDVVAGAGTSLFGLTDSNVANWSGNSHDLSGALTTAAFRHMKTQIANRGGNGASKDSFWMMNSDRLQESYQLQESEIRFTDVKVAIGGAESLAQIVGNPVLVNENCTADRVYFVNKQDIKLACFKEMFQDGDGSIGKDKGNMHFQISQGALTYEAEMWGMYNLEVDARHRSGQLYNIT
jgi:hypothetical protein